MHRWFLYVLCLGGLSPLFTSCSTFSEDSAPGGITANRIGMDAQGVRDWQDRTIRQLAY